MLEQAFILSLCVYFLHACTWEGMVFSPLASRLWNLTRWIRKPLFDCPVCMVPWWGSLLVWIFEWDWSLQLILSAGGIAVLLDAAVNALINGSK